MRTSRLLLVKKNEMMSRFISNGILFSNCNKVYAFEANQIDIDMKIRYFKVNHTEQSNFFFCKNIISISKRIYVYQKSNISTKNMFCNEGLGATKKTLFSNRKFPRKTTMTNVAKNFTKKNGNSSELIDWANTDEKKNGNSSSNCNSLLMNHLQWNFKRTISVIFFFPAILLLTEH